MNRAIKKLSHKTYHGDNLDTIEFELHGLKYYAQKRWNDEGECTKCIYGRTMNNEYYDTIDTLQGEMNGMNNMAVGCVFGNMPVALFDEIAATL